MLIDTHASTLESVRHPRAVVHRGVRVSGRGYPVRSGPNRKPSVQHHRTGVPMSRAPHRPQAAKAITPATAVVLALIAAAITLWLGLTADFGAAAAGAGAAVPERLAVVRVHSGESLQHLAGRVAPDAPTGQVVERIRELNGLESVAVDGGQTLITPMG